MKMSIDHGENVLPSTTQPLAKKVKKVVTKTSQLSDDQKEALIGLVQDYPWLYNPKHKDRKDIQKVTNSWIEIKIDLQDKNNAPAETDVKWEWTRLRQDRSKYKKRHESRSGQGAHSVPHWKFWDQMLFLDDFDPGTEKTFDNYDDSASQTQRQTFEDLFEETQEPLSPTEAEQPIEVDDDDLMYLDDDQQSLVSGFTVERSPRFGPTRALGSRVVPRVTTSNNTPPNVSAASTSRRGGLPSGRARSSKQQGSTQIAKLQDTLTEVANKLVGDQTAEDCFGNTVAQMLKATPKEERAQRMKNVLDCLSEPI